jgi:uncharacterized protein YlxW (UPF0749 family)
MRTTGRPRQTQTSSLQGVAGVIIAQVLFNQKKQQTEATDPALVAAFNEEIASLQAKIRDLEQTVRIYKMRVHTYAERLARAKKKLGQKE